MSHIPKDSFYKDRYYQVSVSSWNEEEVSNEYQKLKELSKNPMPEEAVKEALQNFGKTASGPSYSYLSFIAPEKQLYSIMGIEKFVHLQYIDISHNNLITIKPMSSLKYVTYLNASHNKLSKLLDLKDIPYNLEEADFSFNQIKEIPNLEKHRFLKKLNLSHNNIQQIQGINNNKNLHTLILQENQITTIENLDNMNLTELNLRGNKITQLTGLEKLDKLRILNVSCNKIKKLKGLVDLVRIRELWLSNNLICHIRELQFIENLTYLSVLDLCFNPVQTKRYYRNQVCYHLPGLRVLDGVLTQPEEFVKAENLYGLDLEERRKIFKSVLEDEEFIDRRINIGELIEPETESDNDEDIKFQDKYDREGNLIEVKSQFNYRKSMNGSMGSKKSSQGTQKNFDQTYKSDGENQFRDTLNSHQSMMNETQRKLMAMRNGSLDTQGQQTQQVQNPFEQGQQIFIEPQYRITDNKNEENEQIQY